MWLLKCTNTIERGRPYHKTIAITFAPHLFQIGDDQWSHTDDVGYNIHKMRHTQVIGKDGLCQRGAKGHPISGLSAFQPIDYEFGRCKSVQTTEHKLEAVRCKQRLNNRRSKHG